MGVPGFFAWLLKNYKSANIITSKIDISVDNLYLDANCLFHPQCYKVLDFYENKLTVEKLENKMFQRILNYLDYIISFVNPTKKVFIAVDGVAPMAKMNQQRKRRYKSIYDNNIKDSIKKKYDKNISSIWNNTVITPGTKFMEKLHKHLLNYIKQNRLKLNIEYVYSSYHTVGEGEHKILQDIKLEANNQNNVNVIYGLDADLIFLALASKKDNIYLLREEIVLKNVNLAEKNEVVDIVKDVAENLCFVSIDETKNCINEQFKFLIDKKITPNMGYNIDYENKYFIDDFIVICFLLGNDFIPNLPSIDIKTYGLDYLLNAYVDVFLTFGNGLTYLETKSNISNINIDNIFLEEYLLSISRNEDYYFKVKLPIFYENIKKRSCSSADLYERELWDLDNMRLSSIDDPIKLGYDKPDLYKFRYYEYYYGSTNYQTELINNICDDYLKGICWTIKYYFQKCDSYSWQYKYINAPFASDLSKYFKSKKIDMQHLKLDESITITPFTQLLAVLPPTCYKLLPDNYGSLMKEINSPIIDMYPLNIKIDELYKDTFHKCTPFIPIIDIKRILDATKNIPVFKEDKERNTILDNFIFNHKK
jgi:5'-3' exoribonuclease 1